jgi:O-antigen/teichoic acid export membrane protein
VSEERLGFPRDELRARTARGALVNAVFLGGAEALVLLQGLIVTALLAPDEIGLYGIVSATAVTIVGLKRVGIDEAFVQQSEEGQEAEFQKAFTLELVLSCAFALVICAAAPLVAAVYGESELLALTLAVAYLPLAFALQAPTWVFFRRMDFLRQRMLQAIVPVVTFCVTVPLAAAGVGVWSLVIGPAVGNAAAAAAAIAASPYPLRLRFEAHARRRYFSFSWPIFVTAFALLVVQQGQLIAFDVDEGLAAVGFVTLAFTLTRYADRPDQIVTTTIYPAVVAVRDRAGTLRELFEKSNRATMALALPFCALWVLFAADLVEFVIGDEWRPAVVLVQGLAGAAAVHQLGYNWFAFYRARGESRPQAVESAVLVAGFLGLALPGLAAFGFEGFVWGRIAAALLTLAVRWVYLRRLLPGIAPARLFARGALPTLGATAAALVLRLALWGGGRPGHQALAELALFALAAAALTLRLERGLIGELRALVSRPGDPA